MIPLKNLLMVSQGLILIPNLDKQIKDEFQVTNIIMWALNLLSSFRHVLLRMK